MLLEQRDAGRRAHHVDQRALHGGARGVRHVGDAPGAVIKPGVAQLRGVLLRRQDLRQHVAAVVPARAGQVEIHPSAFAGPVLEQPVIDAPQPFQFLVVTLPKGFEDHAVGGFGAVEEARDIKARIGRQDGADATSRGGVHHQVGRRSRLGQGFGRRPHRLGGSKPLLRWLGRQSLLMAAPLAEHHVEPQRQKRRNHRQKNNPDHQTSET